MKSIYLFSMIAAVAITTAGCCSMCKSHNGEGQTCPSCGMTAKKACPHCGMMKGQCKCPAMVTPAMAIINTTALKSLINSGVKLTLVDARTGKFDDGRRIANAINLSPEATEAEIHNALPSKEALIVSYCANLKCPASKTLASKLTALGYTHVLEYPQGIEGWVSEGNLVAPTVK